MITISLLVLAGAAVAITVPTALIHTSQSSAPRIPVIIVPGSLHSSLSMRRSTASGHCDAMPSVAAYVNWTQWQTVQSHSGFDLPLDPMNRGPFYGGARRHDFHHSHNAGCYSDFLPFWDWLCGTDRHYKAFWEREQQEQQQKAS